MTNRRSVLGVSLAFVLGCVAAPLVQQLVARPAHAQGSPTQKWEQFCEPLTTKGRYLVASDLTNVVNPVLKEKGAAGWELVSVSLLNSGSTDTVGGSAGTIGAVYCFRKPLY
jgi:hypothetical protein